MGSVAKIERFQTLETTEDASLQPFAPLLNRIRFAAAGCRASARVDIFRACALLSLDASAALDAHVEALVSTLSEAIGRRPVFLAPGTLEMSFDERWLLRLIERADAQDRFSAAFLIGRRTRPEHSRALSFLVHGAARFARQVDDVSG